MKKDGIWIDWYPSDFLAGVVDLTPNEGWLYTIVLNMIYDKGCPISDDPARLARRCQMSVPACIKALDALVAMGKVMRSDGVLSNPRAEGQLAKRQQRVERARNSANARWQSDSENDNKNNGGKMPEQSGGKSKPDAKPIQATITTTTTEDSVEGAQKPARSNKKGSRIDPNWILTKARGEYARTRGLRDDTIRREAEKFKNYWIAAPGQKGVKLDWEATWRTWCINTAERLGLKPAGEPPHEGSGPETFTRETWLNLLKIYHTTNDWKVGWGPAPGKPGCLVPPDLLK